MRDDAVRANHAARANGDSLENKCSGPDPGTFANPDRAYLISIGKAIGEALLRTRRMTVVVGNLAVAGDQDIVLDRDFAVAGDGDVVPDEGAVADAQDRMIIKSAGRNGEAPIEADAVANMECGMSFDDWECAQLEALSHRFTAAGK